MKSDRGWRQVGYSFRIKVSCKVLRSNMNKLPVWNMQVRRRVYVYQARGDWEVKTSFWFFPSPSSNNIFPITVLMCWSKVTISGQQGLLYVRARACAICEACGVRYFFTNQLTSKSRWYGFLVVIITINIIFTIITIIMLNPDVRSDPSAAL